MKLESSIIGECSYKAVINDVELATVHIKVECNDKRIRELIERNIVDAVNRDDE